MVFLEKEINFIVKIFWPNRDIAKGFSIENLARKYREKITDGVTSHKTSNQLVDLKSIKEDRRQIAQCSLLRKRGHWANRDFSEYREVA